MSLSFIQESKQTLALALPMMLGQVGQILLSVVDSIMVGQLGVNELAGVSFGSALMLFFLISGMGLCSSVHALVSQSSNSHSKETTLEILAHGIWIVILYGLPLGLFVQFFPDILNYFGQPQEVLVHAKPYAIFIAWSILPALIFRCIRNYSEAWLHPWEPFWVVLFTFFANIFLNWIFIFGNLGFPEMGTAGAGFATFLARILGLILLCFWLSHSTFFKLFLQLKHFLKIKKDLFKQMLLIGTGTAIQIACEFGFFSMITIMMGWLGATELAAQQIISNFSALVFMIPLSIAFATTIRIGNAVGKNDWKKLQKIGYNSAYMGVIFMLTCAIFTVIFRDSIPLIIIKNAEVNQLASFILLFVALSQAFDGLQAISMGALRGIPDIKIPLKIVIFSYWIIGIPCCYYFGFVLKLRAAGINIGIVLALGLAAGLLFYRFRYITLKKLQCIHNNT